jgi:hypothetical protein
MSAIRPNGTLKPAIGSIYAVTIHPTVSALTPNSALTPGTDRLSAFPMNGIMNDVITATAIAGRLYWFCISVSNMLLNHAQSQLIIRQRKQFLLSG